MIPGFSVVNEFVVVADAVPQTRLGFVRIGVCLRVSTCL